MNALIVNRQPPAVRPNGQLTGAAGQNDDEIGADRRKLADDITPRPVAERRQDDDGGDADRHGEHRQRRAHRVAGRRVAGEAQGVSQAHGRYRVRGGRLP